MEMTLVFSNKLRDRNIQIEALKVAQEPMISIRTPDTSISGIEITWSGIKTPLYRFLRIGSQIRVRSKVKNS